MFFQNLLARSSFFPSSLNWNEVSGYKLALGNLLLHELLAGRKTAVDVTTVPIYAILCTVWHNIDSCWPIGLFSAAHGGRRYGVGCQSIHGISPKDL